MQKLTVGDAGAQTGWSARMLRYLEDHGLVTPERTAAGYRLYGLAELNQLSSLRRLRERFQVELAELAFAARLRRDPELRTAVDAWFATSEQLGSVDLAWVAGKWIDWEQRKHERLLAA
jgi:MerR family copper efflux transcriptional regulator